MKLFYEIPEQFNKGYVSEIRQNNFRSVLVLGLLIHLIQIIFYAYNLINPFSTNSLVMANYYFFYQVELFTGIPFLVFLFTFVRKKGNDFPIVSTLIYVYSFILLSWAMGVAIADQFQGEDIVIYYTMLFIFSIAFDYSTFKFTLLVVIMQAVFISGLLIFQSYLSGISEIILTSFQYATFSVIIRYYINELRKKNSVHRQRLEQVNDELYYLSFYDPLSQLHNRRKWESSYHHMFQQAIASKTSIDVIITDIDYFKQYNDHFGHVAGDQVIRDVSAILKQATNDYRSNVGRYGGDEFAISFHQLPESTRANIIANIQTLLKAKNIQNYVNGKQIPLTMSFGCYRIKPSANDKPWDSIIEADQKLYARKIQRHPIH